MDILIHMAAHAVQKMVESSYHGIRKMGYSSDAKEYYLKRGYSEAVASEKADVFAKELEEAKEKGESKEKCRQICVRHGLPYTLFVK